MLRRTTARKMVPCHPVVPGNFSHRGFLYRNSNQNYHSRVAPMIRHQMTWEESYRKTVLLPHPHYAFFLWVCMPFYIFFFYLLSWYNCYESGQDQIAPHGNKVSRGYDIQPENVVRRNRQLITLFEGHRTLFAELRAETEVPDVMQPPANSNYREAMKA